MRISDLDFELPAELIATEPLVHRDGSRLLCVDRSPGTYRDTSFSELPRILKPNDVLVLNNTKVFPARLLGTTETGASIEIFLVEDAGDGVWSALAKPAKRLKPGRRIGFGSGLDAEVVGRNENGQVTIRFAYEGDLFAKFDEIGRTPLPPYIKRERNSLDSDRERYQTVYARHRGAIAAPTAGLHFTPAVIESLKSLGVLICEVTLHVGYGTFEPIRVDDLSQHSVSPERYEISEETAELLNAARAEGRRIISVGTTTTRTLEYALSRNDLFRAETGYADLTILPGYRFRAIDALLTNFHLPKSSLLVLVSTFAGRELIMNAYRHAVEMRYRFYSYGDCMLIT